MANIVIKGLRTVRLLITKGFTFSSEGGKPVKIFNFRDLAFTNQIVSSISYISYGIRSLESTSQIVRTLNRVSYTSKTLESTSQILRTTEIGL